MAGNSNEEQLVQPSMSMRSRLEDSNEGSSDNDEMDFEGPSSTSYDATTADYGGSAVNYANYCSGAGAIYDYPPHRPINDEYYGCGESYYDPQQIPSNYAYPSYPSTNMVYSRGGYYPYDNDYDVALNPPVPLHQIPSQSHHLSPAKIYRDPNFLHDYASVKHPRSDFYYGSSQAESTQRYGGTPFTSQNNCSSGYTTSLSPSYQQLHQHQIAAQQPLMSSGLQRVQMWNAHNASAFHVPQQNDSGVHSMSHSSATSVISSIHAASQISGVSSQHSGHGGGCAGGDVHLSEAQRARFNNIPSNFSRASPEQVRRILPDLIPLLNDGDEDEVVCEALNILQRIVMHDNGDTLYSSGNYASSIVDGVFQAMDTFRNNKAIIRGALRSLYNISSNRRHGVELLAQTIEKTEAKCLDGLLNAICIRELSCFKYAIIILHSLVIEPHVSRTVVAYARKARALSSIVERLDEHNEKFLIIVIDIVRYLVECDAAQKTLFCTLNGLPRLIHILETAQYNNLLLRTSKLLSSISNCVPAAVVEAGAFDALHLRLQHADRRLVRELLVCLCRLSDVRANVRDLSALLEKLVYIFGSRHNDRDELRIQQACAQILTNLSANNPTNKAFLVRHGIVDVAFGALFDTESLLERARAGGGGTSINSQQLEDIQENTLTLLGNICSGHALAHDAQRDIMRARLNGDIFLQKLSKKRVILLRRTLRILCYTASNDANLARFREILPLQGMAHNSLPLVPYVREIVECLYISISNNSQTIEGVQIADVARDAMSVLQYLCRDNFLLDTIVSYLRRSLITVTNKCERLLLPQFALRCDNLRAKALAFCSELARHQQISQLLSRDVESMRVIRSCAMGDNLANASNNSMHAQRCLDWIQKYSALPNHQPLHSSTAPPQSPFLGHQSTSAAYQDMNISYVQPTDYVNRPHARTSNDANSKYGNNNRAMNYAQNYGDSTFHDQQPMQSQKQYDGGGAELRDCITSPLSVNSSVSWFQRLEYASNGALEADRRRNADGVVEGVSHDQDNDDDDDEEEQEDEDEDDEFGGAAARCSTPIDASSLHATIGAVTLNDTMPSASTAIADEWLPFTSQMSASINTIIEQQNRVPVMMNSAQIGHFEEDLSIASAICGMPKMPLL